MADIDIKELAKEITQAASDVIDKDIKDLRGFSKHQVTALAHQADLIAKGVEKGDIDKNLRDYFLDSLEDMALNFVKTLRGLLVVTIEKVWNAVVGVLWKAIENVTGIKLAVPNH